VSTHFFGPAGSGSDSGLRIRIRYTGENNKTYTNIIWQFLPVPLHWQGQRLECFRARYCPQRVRVPRAGGGGGGGVPLHPDIRLGEEQRCRSQGTYALIVLLGSSELTSFFFSNVNV
jgi:hypothetical protein